MRAKYIDSLDALKEAVRPLLTGKATPIERGEAAIALLKYYKALELYGGDTVHEYYKDRSGISGGYDEAGRALIALLNSKRHLPAVDKLGAGLADWVRERVRNIHTLQASLLGGRFELYSDFFITKHH